ncbi:MAG: ATP-dependent carboxylate-amine ligase [Halapricum sp.]
MQSDTESGSDRSDVQVPAHRERATSGDNPPTVLLLDGDYDNTLSVARELSEDLDARILGTGTTRYSRLLRSNYCDVGEVVPAPGEAGYADALLDVMDRHRPQIVLPVGYDSMAAVDSIRSEIPDAVGFCLPPPASFRLAVDKASTLQRAERLGIPVPTDYSDTVEQLDASGRPTPADALPFPVFLKARHENGTVTTARVDEPATFWTAYDGIAAEAAGGNVLVQEYVDGPDVTFGCGVLCLDDEIELLVSHQELRSVPRHGGSGTHLRLVGNPTIEAKTTKLLRDIGWNGIALVEFRQRPDGTYVLMEINPKFWASYALASRFGYRFASTMVAGVLDLDVTRPIGTPRRTGEMVFPLRELQQYARNRRDERLLDCIGTIMAADARWDIDTSDLGAWLTPPTRALRKLPTLSGNRRTEQTSSGSDRPTAPTEK